MWIIGTFLPFQFGRLLERSDMSVIFVFMLAYTVATISQCFMFSVLFSKANVAAACAGIFYFIGYLPFSLCLHWDQYMSATQKGLAVRISHVFSPVTTLHARHFSHWSCYCVDMLIVSWSVRLVSTLDIKLCGRTQTICTQTHDVCLVSALYSD